MTSLVLNNWALNSYLSITADTTFKEIKNNLNFSTLI